MISLFNKPIGVEVTDNLIKAVQTEKRIGKPKILRLSQITLNPGIVEKGRIKDEEGLMEAFKKLFLEAKPSPITEKKIVFSLAVSQLYTHTFKLPPHKKKERNSLISKEVEANIPLEKDDLVFSYKIVGKDKGAIEILLIAISKAIVLEWQKFFQKLDLEVIAFDLESLAIFRALFPEKTNVPICIIDIDTINTKIAIFNKAGLRYSHAINIGGKNFTETIAEELQIKLSRAEKEKNEIGLTNKNDPVFKALDKILKLIIEELKELFNYFEQTTKQKIKKIILIGRDSQLKGITNYLSDNLGLKVEKATLKLFKKEVPLAHIEAFGLTLKGMSKKWINDPRISAKENLLNKTDNVKNGGQFTGSSMMDFSLSAAKHRKKAKKAQSNKVILVIVLILGIICLGMAYSYRNKQRAERKQEIESQIEQYANTQSFNFKVPIAVNPSKYTTEKIRGRIITSIIQDAENYNAAVLTSKVSVIEKLESGEQILPEPINKLTDQGSVIFPLIVEWIAYSEEDANRLFLKEVDKINKNNINYILNNIEKTGIEETQDPDLYYIVGTTTISSDELIEIEG